MAEALIGTWIWESDEKLEELFQAMELPILLRKVGLSCKPVITISKEGEEWKILSRYPMQQSTVKFKLHQIVMENWFGLIIKFRYGLEDDKLIQEQADPGQRLKIIWSVTKDKLVETIEYGAVICTRKYRKQTPTTVQVV